MVYYDQLCFFDYHKKYLQRVVIIIGYSCVTPFCDLEGVRFILRVPLHLRIHKYIFKKDLILSLSRFIFMPDHRKLGWFVERLFNRNRLSTHFTLDKNTCSTLSSPVGPDWVTAYFYISILMMPPGKGMISDPWCVKIFGV